MHFLFNGKDWYVLLRLSHHAARPENKFIVLALQLTLLEGWCLCCFPLGPEPLSCRGRPTLPRPRTGVMLLPFSLRVHLCTCVCTCVRVRGCVRTDVPASASA